MLVDRDGRIAFVNGQTERMFGHARDDVLGKPLELLVPERPRGRHDVFGRRKDGAEFPVEVTLTPVETSKGTYTYATIRDVSERRRAEGELDRLRRQQEVLLTSVAEGVLGLDERGVITHANPGAAKLLGYRVDEILGKNEHDLFHKRKLDGSLYPEESCPIHRSVQDGTTHHATGEVFWRKNGASFPVEYTSAPVRENGRPVGASLIFADVSDRQKSEEIARSANRRVIETYEALPDAFVSVDSEWRVLYVNPPGERLLQQSRDHAVGKRFWDAFPEIAGTAWEPEIRRAMQQRVRARAEDEHARLHRWFELTASPTEGGLLLSFRDVTDSKRGEAAARDASIARPLARRIVQELVEQGAVAHQTLTQVGRKFASETDARTLDDHLGLYREMGLGSVEMEKREGVGRYAFSGSDLLERRPESRVATCSFTLGYLSEAVARVHAGEPTLGTEIECQSRGAPRCRFVVQVKKPEEGLARRVKELI